MMLKLQQHTVKCGHFQVNWGYTTGHSFSIRPSPVYSLGTNQFFFISSLIQSHHVFLRHPLSLIVSMSIPVQHLIQSASSLSSTRPNHLNLPFLMTKTKLDTNSTIL